MFTFNKIKTMGFLYILVLHHKLFKKPNILVTFAYEKQIFVANGFSHASKTVDAEIRSRYVSPLLPLIYINGLCIKCCFIIYFNIAYAMKHQK